MIIEYTYSQEDLRKKCHGCKWLKIYPNDDWYGKCECPYNKVKFRERSITDKKCTWKNADKAEKV
jgi:hypothetical protein